MFAFKTVAAKSTDSFGHEHRVLVESKESVSLRLNPKQRRQRKTEERHRQRSRLVRTGRTNCSGGTTAAASSCELSLDLATIEKPVTSPHLDHEGWLRWTYDTGVPILAFPLGAKMGTQTQANECSYKTATGELISNRGGLRAQGTAAYGFGVFFKAGRQTSTKL